MNLIRVIPAKGQDTFSMRSPLYPHDAFAYHAGGRFRACPDTCAIGPVDLEAPSRKDPSRNDPNPEETSPKETSPEREPTS